MKDIEEPNDYNDEIDNIKLWKVYTNETNSAALKLNFRHASTSNCNLLCAKQSLKSTNYKNHLPYPLSQNPQHVLKDTVHVLVNKKRNFQLEVEEITSTFRKHQRKLSAKKQFQCYEDMQNVLIHEPDKYFCSNYNWYYTGGNLQFQNVGDNNLLFHVLNNKLAVAKIKRKPLHWKVYKKENLTNEFTEDVFQLDSFHKNNVLLVSARQKYKVFLFEILLEDETTSKQIDVITSDEPFVGQSINKNNGTEYTTINTNQMLNIWDIPSKKLKFKHQIPVKYDDLDGDYFAQISYRNDNSLTYINRTELYLFDTRTDCKTNMYIKYTDLIASIDKFTNICPNKINDSYFFVSSFRDVLQMDIRYLSAVNKWCHTFNNAPLFSELTTINNRNIFCTSSFHPTEKVLIDDGNLPEYLPSCIKSFEVSALHNPYLNKQEEILSRLNISTTGMHLHHKNDGKVVLFTVNSVGDLFSQDLIQDETDKMNISKMNSKFQKWNNSIVDWYKDKNNYEKITVVDKVVLRDLKIDPKNPLKNNTALLKNERIKDCVLNLKKSRKGFNNKITDIWYGVGDTISLNDIEEVAPHTNVTNWLNQSSHITTDNNMEF